VIPPRLAYTLFMLLAAVVFVTTRHFVPKPAGLRALSAKERLALLLAAFIGGSFAAKLPFVFVHAEGPLRSTAWLADGKTVVLALAGGYLGVEFAKKCLRIRVKTGDTFALPLALSLAVGRWGCFFNGCCHGTPTSLPWGVAFETEGGLVYCHPTQVYESLFHLAMAGVIGVLMWKGALVRQRLKLYLICYGVFRFLTEFIRPEPPLALGLTFYQWAALLLSAALVGQWLVDRQPAGVQMQPASA
jgi:phosphatidylglycerol:prolipoprotein diacylglycerol transferase